MSPTRLEIQSVVNKFTSESKYQVNYYENKKNLGFDGNLRQLIRCANGRFVIFMGDDDFFIPEALSKFISFLKNNINIKYFLRSYLSTHPNGEVEEFHYLSNTTTIPCGEKSVSWLFKRSVTICGFTISRSEAIKHETMELDGTLLYQVYLMSQVCMNYESIYYDIPIVHATQSFREDKPKFGASDAEKSKYSPGKVTQDNSVNFAKSYFEVTDYLDKIHNTNLTKMVRVDLSKYSYPFLSIQRKRGVVNFLRYAKRLENELDFGCTLYFYLYKWSLVFLGERLCDRFILTIKRVIGHSPNL
jgi:glycosyltransferase involved in cell wall biosynthesis